MLPAAMAEALITMRGAMRSGRPMSASAYAPITKPAWTPLDSAASWNGDSDATLDISGRMAAETNHKLMAVTSARSRKQTERVFIEIYTLREA